MAQLVEWSILIPEVPGSTPVTGKIYIEHLFTINCIEKTKINKKRPGIDHFLKKILKICREKKTKKAGQLDDSGGAKLMLFVPSTIFRSYQKLLLLFLSFLEVPRGHFSLNVQNAFCMKRNWEILY